MSVIYVHPFAFQYLIKHVQTISDLCAEFALLMSAEVLQVYRGQECEALPGFSPMLEAYYVDLCRSDSRRPVCHGRESRG